MVRFDTALVLLIGAVDSASAFSLTASPPRRDGASTTSLSSTIAGSTSYLDSLSEVAVVPAFVPPPATTAAYLDSLLRVAPAVVAVAPAVEAESVDDVVVASEVAPVVVADDAPVVVVVEEESAEDVDVVVADVPEEDGVATFARADAAEAVDDALRDPAAAAALLEELNGLRRAGRSEEADARLDELAAVVDAPTPWWTRARLSARVSRRARRASLRRLAALSAPPSDDENDAKRRGLALALRGLTDGTRSVGALERAARRDVDGRVDDPVARRPAGLETPAYEVLDDRRGYEVRAYDPFAVCSTTVDSSSGGSFNRLAGYLFGKNDQNTAMKMTTPVLMSDDDAGNDGRRMSFVLPSDYWGEDGVDRCPRPLADDGVALERVVPGARAVVMFGGFASSDEVKRRETELLRTLETDKEWTPVAPTTFQLAQYNDPFTPPWKRLNEVSVAVERAPN